MPAHLQSHLNGIFRPRLVPTGSEAPDGILLSDLVGHWDLSEASGDRADSTSYANPMVEGGITPIAQAAGVGAGQTAASFAHAGGQQYLWTSESSDFVLGSSVPLFINFWVRFSSAAASFRSYIHTNTGPDEAGGGYNLQIEVTSGNGQANFKVRDTNNSTVTGINGGAVITNATWCMVSLYANVAANSRQVYKNGALVAGGTFAGSYDSSPLRLVIGNSITARMQALSVWRGAGAVAAKDQMAWLYNSGTSARLYSDISTYMGA